jgi:hypothetical protein
MNLERLYSTDFKDMAERVKFCLRCVRKFHPILSTVLRRRPKMPPNRWLGYIARVLAVAFFRLHWADLQMWHFWRAPTSRCDSPATKPICKCLSAAKCWTAYRIPC